MKFLLDPPILFLAALFGPLAFLHYTGLAALFIGLLLWSFFEYASHRWLLHGLLSRHHRLHHARPSLYVSLPLAVSVLGYSLFVVLLTDYVAGLLVGYLIYETSHRLTSPWHCAHHRWPRASFGVSSPLWDKLLRT